MEAGHERHEFPPTYAYSIVLKYQPVSVNKHEKRQTKVVNCVNNTFSVYVMIKVFFIYKVRIY